MLLPTHSPILCFQDYYLLLRFQESLYSLSILPTSCLYIAKLSQVYAQFSSSIWKPRVELGHNQINLSSKLLHLTLLPLTPPTQYHKPLRNPLLKKAEKNPLNCILKNLGISCHSLDFPTTIQVHSSFLTHRSPSLLPTEAFFPPVFTFNLSFTFSRHNSYQAPAHNPQRLPVPTE